MKALTRQCRECVESLPLGNFEDEDDPTSNLCFDCARKLANKAKRVATAKNRTSALKRYLSTVNKAERAPRTDEFLHLMIKKFGGLQGYVDDFYDFLKACKDDEAKRTSKTYLDGLRFIGTMIKDATAQSQVQQQIEQRSSEELLEMFFELIEAQSPEDAKMLLENSADRVGLRVITAEVEEDVA